MDTSKITIGDNARHKTKFLNGNAPMKVSKIKDNQALCDHFEPNEEGGTTPSNWVDANLVCLGWFIRTDCSFIYIHRNKKTTGSQGFSPVLVRRSLPDSRT